MARWISLMLVALCALGPAAISPALAAAQGAEDEYNLDLPGSGANADTPPSSSGTTGSDSSDSGGFPVLVVVLVAGAGLAVGIAVWRMRKPAGPDEPAAGPPNHSASP